MILSMLLGLSLMLIVNKTKNSNSSIMVGETSLHIFALTTIVTLFQINSVESSLDLDFVPEPQFLDPTVDINVTSYVGQTARLPCTIKHLGQKRVSWIRGRDLQVLSTGRTTFATDVRVSILPGNRIIKKDRTRREMGASVEPESLKMRYDTESDKKIGKWSVSTNTTQRNGQTDLRKSSKASIFIHSHDHKKKNSSFKKITVPYNYLDGIWEPDDYALQIKFAERSDSGKYICQINTEPRMSQDINLRIVYMVAEIAGKKELFVKEGSSVALTCKVNRGSNLPGFIFWFKNSRIIDYEPSNGRIQVKTSLSGKSELVLANANANDTANYTCSPSGGRSVSAMLTVIADERPAAMQQGNEATGLRVGHPLRHLTNITFWLSIVLVIRYPIGVICSRRNLFICAAVTLCCVLSHS